MRELGFVLLGGLLSLCVGCGDMEIVDEPDGTNVAPVAVLVAPLRIGVGAPVFLDARGSTDEDGRIVEYWYEPGEDDTVLESVSPELYHTFRAPGTYVITLHVIDDSGSKDTDRAEIEVE